MPGRPAPDERAVVERFVVVSPRDGEHVVGPLESRKQAEEEAARLSRESARMVLLNGPTAVGQAVPPIEYVVQSIEAADPDALRAAREAHIAALEEFEADAKKEKRADDVSKFRHNIDEQRELDDEGDGDAG